MMVNFKEKHVIVMDEPGSSSQCLVCTAPVNSTRFGLDACRACASFFKRAKISGQKYTCRQGDRQCSTGKDEKYVCRGCRFEKCVAIGMEWDGPMRIRKKRTVPILKRIKMQSKALIDRRVEKERKIIKQHGRHQKISHPIEDVYYIHQETYMEIYEIFLEESYEFFINVYPEFSKLTEKERASLDLIFKDYIVKMKMVEDLKRALQLWGGINKYQMFSVITCVDVGKLHFMETEDTENKDFTNRYTQKYAEEFDKIYRPIFNKCTLTEQEYYALMALVMYEIDIAPAVLSEDAESILEKYRNEALQDLQSHYKKELGLRNFSTKLGNLMTASHAIQEAKSAFKVFYSFYSTIVDVCRTENMIKDFYL